MSKIVQAREPFSVTLPDGTPFAISAGDRFADDDPAVVGREHLFQELTVRATPRPSTAGATETTSAAPGSRRTRTTPPQNTPSQTTPPKEA